MKNNLMIPFLLMIATSAYADYGTITCNTSTPVSLEFEEMSDISKETLRFSLNNQKVELNDFNTTSTDYGLLSITINVGNAQDSKRYIFDNLGSSDCIGVFQSNQNGPATIKVLNERGAVEEASCTCSVD